MTYLEELAERADEREKAAWITGSASHRRESQRARQFAAFLRGIAIPAFLALLSGCGGATAEVRTAYAVEQANCLARERAIIDEPCGDLDAEACRTRDYDAMRAERERCDAALRAIYGGE